MGGSWYDRSGARPPVNVGLAIAAVGMGLWASAVGHLDYVTQLPGMIVTGVGLGLVLSPSNTDALSRVTGAERSQASGIVQTVRQLGGALGIAVIGSVILGIVHQGTQTPVAQHAADAIGVGFWVASGSFVIALICGVAFISRERIADDDRAIGVVG